MYDYNVNIEDDGGFIKTVSVKAINKRDAMIKTKNKISKDKVLKAGKFIPVHVIKASDIPVVEFTSTVGLEDMLGDVK